MARIRRDRKGRSRGIQTEAEDPNTAETTPVNHEIAAPAVPDAPNSLRPHISAPLPQSIEMQPASSPLPVHGSNPRESSEDEPPRVFRSANSPEVRSHSTDSVEPSPSGSHGAPPSFSVPKVPIHKEPMSPKAKEPILSHHPHSYLVRTASLAQMAREHKMALEPHSNDTRKFYDLSPTTTAGVIGTSSISVNLEDTEHHLTRGGTPSPAISRHQSYTRLDDAAMDYLGHRPNHFHGQSSGHDRKEDTNLLFRTGSRMFSNSGFELGIGGDGAAWGSRHASRSNSRAASRRNSGQYILGDGDSNDSGSDIDISTNDAVLHMGRRFRMQNHDGSDESDDSSDNPDEAELYRWSSLADSRLIRWTDKLLGLGGQDSITGLREFLKEPHKPKLPVEKRKYREKSILSDPVLVLALATVFTNSA